LGVRADALLLVESLTHFDTDDPAPDRHSRVLPAADARLEASCLFTPGGAIVFATGPEIAMGTTDVYLNGRAVTKLPPLRLVVDVGIRVRF
jgi:hypothetical protein